MILRSLTTESFRNLAAGEIPFHAAVNIVLGRNGQGKTNLLEAVYFLATTKSFRTNRIASVFRFDSPSVYVAGALERHGVTRTLSVGLEHAEARRRVLMINGEKIALPAYLNAMSVFAYSQSRLEILRGAPEEKRRFLDRGIASINAQYLEQLSRYLRVLKQRNALLAEDPTASSLDAWNDELVSAAAPIHRARAAYAQEIGAAFAKIVETHGYHVRDLEIVYRGSGEEDALRETLARIRRHELRARMTLTGPQRDTIDFLVGGRNAAEVLSGGELKMIVLFLKFAKVELFRARHDEPPLFLLDDIDAELDLEVLQKLLSGLPSKTQVFATSAKESFLHALEAGPHRRLIIENGLVTTSRDFA
ncbi:MAG TPA: DNA replication and repair protein RecF [Thermoanaerobaculia bacterium]|nr:DNA replication and repair protein RecF [Thermoanaerobaculia bacterium]